MKLTELLSYFCLLLFTRTQVLLAVSWEEWWTYDGISGPAFWGLINPEWSLCNKGRRQSPVNLEPQRLLFDPNLRPLHIDKHRISGLISNTGHSVIFTAGNETVANYDGMQTPVNISGGPLSYRYRFHEIHIHYGLHDQFGSEHSVEGYTFPAEVSKKQARNFLFSTEIFST
ncbi:PREDICTED: carbonic anhydrase-related protein 10-like [Rhagoletis zephyria]|uniref:carbonic anhydrase-related protein 10-like n=1 Tax=Rhagoletis zephyria TaxID=28612 RepID=UPI0008117DB4|nr:PREDICTED: carbonic anhydrase-related protein 10-like [Rhagoletis zephyria]